MTSTVAVRLLGSVGLSALFAASSPAWAADEQQPAEAVRTEGLGEIVVTAQRRAERLEDVPMTITALDNSAIENRGVRNLQDLGQLVPAAQINLGGSWTQPSLRGITTLTAGFQYENNVAVYIDGYYQSNSGFLNTDFANLESIQVLKGPQGALYGRNATGGAILIATAAPSDTLTGKVEAKYGEYDDFTLSGFVSGPLAPGVSASIAGYRRKSDGYYDKLDPAGKKIGNGSPLTSESVRAKVAVDLTDDLTATFGYAHIHYSNPLASIFTNEKYRPTTGALALPPKVGRLYEPYTVSMLHDPIFNGYGHEPTLTLRWKTAIGTLNSYSGFDRRTLTGQYDFDGSYAAKSYNFQKYREGAFQQGVDYNIDTIKNLDLIVGGTYWDDSLKLDSFAGSGNTFTSRTIQRFHNKAWALFADANYHLGDLSIGLGGRYTQEDRSIRNLVTILATGAKTPAIGSASFNNFSPRLSLRYEIEPGTNVYGSISRGFRSGQLQVVNTSNGTTVIPTTPPVDPEKITAYEIGFKTARSRFRFDTSAWYYDYTNLQVGLTLPNPLCSTCGPINLVSNAPKAEIYGVEAQLNFLPFDDLDLNVAGAWTHARYTDFAAATAVGLNTTTQLNVPGQIQDWSGQEMARAPAFTATVGAEYTLREVAGGNLRTSLNYKYTDSYVLNNASLFGPLAGPALANKQRFRQGSYSLVNGSITWTDASDHFKIGLWANNIFDKKYLLSRNGNVFGEYGDWAMPRQIGGTIGYQF